MRRVWIVLGLLGLLLGGTLAHSRYLDRFTAELTQQLSQAALAADRGHWDQADALTRSARQQWEDRALYLHSMLHHGALDQIRAGFAQAQAYLDHRAPWEYCAALAALITQLELLSEAEQLTVQNVL